MELPSYFIDFLAKIRLTVEQRTDCCDGHTTLRKRLFADEALKAIVVSTFLQGSYRRFTAIRPHEGRRADVDVVVVTRLDSEEVPPVAALERFRPFMREHYKGKYEYQERSIGIELSYVDLDLVVTAAPSEADVELLRSDSVVTQKSLEELDDWRLVPSWLDPDRRSGFRAKSLMEQAAAEPEWKLSPLYIPDRDVEEWEQTHPLEQLRWTRDKNRATTRHYVNVVKAVKWWRRVNYTEPEYPKGYPVEHLVGACCPDGIPSVGYGVTVTLESIAVKYKEYANSGNVPFLPDHGVPEHNVFARISGEDFALFHSQVCEAAVLARAALNSESIVDSVRGWQRLFGDQFPNPPSDDDGNDDDGPKKGGFTPRKEESMIDSGRFA